jgi:hypothetical protein
MLGEGALRMESGIPWLATEARKKKRTPSVDLPTDRSVFSPFDPFNPYFPLLKARSRGSWKSGQGRRQSGINNLMIRIERTRTDTNGSTPTRT